MASRTKRRGRSTSGDTRKRVVPEVLGTRGEIPHDRYSHDREAMSLLDVGVTFTTGAKDHEVRAPMGSGDTARRLRRFSLVLSRLGVPYPRKYATKWVVPASCVEGASRMVSIEAYTKAFGDDVTEGTIHTAPIVSALNDPSGPSHDAVVLTMSLVGTQAYADIVKGITDEELSRALVHRAEHNYKYMVDDRVPEYEDINSPHPGVQRTARWRYQRLARELDSDAQAVVGQWHDRAGERRRREQGDEGTNTPGARVFGNGPAGEGLNSRWWDLFLSKPPLEISHSGRLGRKVRASNEGRDPRFVERMFTEDDYRIFGRKTRSLGAVIVVDCSGSMSWNEDDLDRLIVRCSGATVLAYSTGNTADEDNPNAWIVARKNRRVRDMPYFPGGNGCDGPALLFAVRQLRNGNKNPVIWVSDGRVTGRSDAYSEALWDDCERLIDRYGIHHCRDMNEAMKLINRLSGRR